MEFKVYALRNKQNKIVYIGLTRVSLQKRYEQHIWKKQLNREEYKIELIQDNLTQEQAAELEKMLIIHYNTVNDGLNGAYGSATGNSVYHTEETKEYLRSLKKGIPVSKEHADKNRKARIGMKNSEKHKKAVSDGVSKPVMCLENGIIYKSGREAAKLLNLNYSKICLVCYGKRHTTGGLHFVFVKKEK